MDWYIVVLLQGDDTHCPLSQGVFWCCCKVCCGVVARCVLALVQGGDMLPSVPSRGVCVCCGFVAEL